MKMNAYLLYSDKESDSWNRYLFQEDLIKDLNLNQVFNTMAGKDEYIFSTVKNVMTNPLPDFEAVKYRQDIISDCISNQEDFDGFYRIAARIMKEIEKYRENVSRKNAGSLSTSMAIYNSLEILLILVKGMGSLKEYTKRVQSVFNSEGMITFCKRLQDDYNVEFEEEIEKSIQEMIFLNKGGKIVLNVSIGQGLRGCKISIAKLMPDTYNDKKSLIDKMKHTYYRFFRPNMILLKDATMKRESQELSQAGLHHILKMYDGFAKELTAFFEHLKFQTAFYIGCTNLHNKVTRMGLPTCMPKEYLPKQVLMEFLGLYEMSMACMTGKVPVSNKLEARGKNLILISGANQGGKSTYLRSIGIAQVFLQCGMFVPAIHYANHFSDQIFTHFTRREDQSLNSGRLDEELKRMRRIITRITKKSMLLLNESFASTTEKEGSIIAEDILTALYEDRIQVLMVTHLYELLQNMYRKELENAMFLSAERLEDGKRTFHMLEAKPSYTSYGMDLYEEIING